MNFFLSFLLTIILYTLIENSNADTMNDWKRFEISRPINDYLKFMEIEVFLNDTKLTNDQLIFSMSSLLSVGSEISKCFDNNLDSQCHTYRNSPIIYVEAKNTSFDRISITNRGNENVNSVYMTIYDSNDIDVYYSLFPSDVSTFRTVFEFKDICEVGSISFGNGCWCRNGFYSNTGLAPCDQCDVGDISIDIIGSTKCKCGHNTYSIDGFAPCNNCGRYSTTRTETRYLLENNPALKVPPSYSSEMTTLSHESKVWDSYYSVSWGADYNRVENLVVTGAKECRCEIGYRSDDGITNCEACPLHSISGAGGSRQRFYIYGFPLASYDNMFRNVVFYNTKNIALCQCDVGYYGVQGLPPCTKCPDNSYTQLYSVGQSTCKCNVGYYGISGNIPCTACPIGYSNTDFGGASIDTCTKCAIGYYSPTGNAPCISCSVGQTTSIFGSTFCIAIPAGTPSYEPTEAPTGPTEAPTMAPFRTRRPTGVPTLHPTEIHDCWIGYSSNTGKEPCNECPIGSTNEEPGLTTCDKCIEGYYHNTTLNRCIVCPYGFTSDYNKKFCTLCIGEYPCANSMMELLTINGALCIGEHPCANSMMIELALLHCTR